MLTLPSSKAVLFTEIAPATGCLIDTWKSSSSSCNPPNWTNPTTYAYGIDWLDFAVQLVSVGASGGLSWCFDGYDSGKDCGMWYRPGGDMVLRPWYYASYLMCRYLPPIRTSIFTLQNLSSSMRGFCAKIQSPSSFMAFHWTVVLVNRASVAATVTVNPIGIQSPATTDLFTFSESSLPTDGSLELPAVTQTTACMFRDGLQVTIPPNAAILISTLNHNPVPMSVQYSRLVGTLASGMNIIGNQSNPFSAQSEYEAATKCSNNPLCSGYVWMPSQKLAYIYASRVGLGINSLWQTHDRLLSCSSSSTASATGLQYIMKSYVPTPYLQVIPDTGLSSDNDPSSPAGGLWTFSDAADTCSGSAVCGGFVMCYDDDSENQFLSYFKGIAGTATYSHVGRATYVKSTQKTLANTDMYSSDQSALGSSYQTAPGGISACGSSVGCGGLVRIYGFSGPRIRLYWKGTLGVSVYSKVDNIAVLKDHTSSDGFALLPNATLAPETAQSLTCTVYPINVMLRTAVLDSTCVGITFDSADGALWWKSTGTTPMVISGNLGGWCLVKINALKT